MEQEKKTHMKGICVKSEIAPLKKVLLHRPGEELLKLTPKRLGELLLDDIPFLKVAQREHDAFAAILRENGVEVVYLEDLMSEVLALHPELVRPFLYQWLTEGNIRTGKWQDKLCDYLLENYSGKALVEKTMEGITLKEMGGASAYSLQDRIAPADDLIVDPMPNLYFARDPFASVGTGVFLNRMRFPTRRRETIYAEYIFNYHPDFSRIHRYYNRDDHASIEGGDVAAVRTVLAFSIPSSRAFMHLDTVFTQIDQDKYIVHPAIIGPLTVYEIRPGEKDPADLHIERIDAPLERILEKYTHTERVKLIHCGGDDMIAAAREQWNDGSNTLAIAPGRVVVYERNDVTNPILRDNGIEILEMPAAELSRGRGGPRCMSMPLFRAEYCLEEK